MAQGKPVIAGTRITVELVLEKLGSGESVEDLLEAHPRLTREGVVAALRYAGEVLRNDLVYPTGDTDPPPSAWRRVVVQNVTPEVDAGRYPVKRVVGDDVVVEADLVVDGHDRLDGRLLYRRRCDERWQEEPLAPLVNDRWRAAFRVEELGRYEYTVEAWVDEFQSWRQGLVRKLEAGEDVAADLLAGAAIVVGRAADAGGGEDARVLGGAAERMADRERPADERAAEAVAETLALAMRRHPDRTRAARYPRVLEVVVDRPLARAGAWYEFFPRSFGPSGRHGTFADAERMLEYVASMGFDVVYLPPIHPIGRSFRKGPDNTLRAGPDDPGSPWAIGAAEGGHKAIHEELGTLGGFQRFQARARELGMELALDVALQCSPDHPYVREHPEWFRHRPDGSIQYAENPPKKYQDICPFDFECEAWESLWEELYSIFAYWIGQGVRIFRVDNPHTKPLAFWEWCIGRVKDDCPEAIFLAEAFTRPKTMYTLAKIGFTQSYTYFAWRRFRGEIVEYLTELTRTEVAEFFRPSFWPNTPDILPDDLQHAPRGGFAARLVLAATLASSYGIYGPAFELMENVPRPGSGEYLGNEKYELKSWDLEREDSLRPLITRLNHIRREHPALRRNDTLVFHACDNDDLICFSKSDGEDLVIVVVNLDYRHRQGGWVDLDAARLGVDRDQRLQLHDLISDAHLDWRAGRNRVELDPCALPAQVFRVRRLVRREEDFDYFA